MIAHESQPMTASPPASRTRASERVAGILSDRIRSGVYRAGDLLPTERTLAADLRVHRRSVQTAIAQLVQDGLVSQRPNCRPTVAPPPPETKEEKGRGATEHAGRRASSPISASNLVALIMWHGGGPLEHAGTSQQRIFWGMNQALTKFGYHAVFLDVGNRVGVLEEEDAAREAAHLRYVRDQKFGGVVFYPYAYRHNHDLVREVSQSVPLVLLDRRVPGADVDFLGIENHGPMTEITRYLLAQGHRRIAHVTRIEPIHTVQDRIYGYLDAMRAADAPDMVEMLLNVPPYDEDRAWSVVDAVFRLPKDQRPTAAICFNDYMADSLAARLKHLGLSVPQDVALTGFDNIIPALPDGTGLTTAAQPYEQIGITAVDLLMRRIKAPLSPPQSVELPVRLIVRASSTSQAAVPTDTPSEDGVLVPLSPSAL